MRLQRCYGSPTVHFYRRTSERRRVIKETRYSTKQLDTKNCKMGRFIWISFLVFTAYLYISFLWGSGLLFPLGLSFCIITWRFWVWVWAGLGWGRNWWVGWAGWGEKQRCFREFSLLDGFTFYHHLYPVFAAYKASDARLAYILIIRLKSWVWKDNLYPQPSYTYLQLQLDTSLAATTFPYTRFKVPVACLCFLLLLALLYAFLCACVRVCAALYSAAGAYMRLC